MTTKYTATKAHSAGLGGVIGSAIAVLIQHFFDFPEEVAGALTVLVAVGVPAALAWLATYFAPPNTPKAG